MSLKNYLKNKPFLFRVARVPWRTYLQIRDFLFKAYLFAGFRRPELLTINYNDHIFKILVDPRSGYIDACIHHYKYWDKSLSDTFIKYLRKDSTCIDVGANIGFLSLLAASIVGADGKVLAIEPLEEIVLQLQKSKEANNFSQLSIIPSACGNRDGEVSFYATKDTGVSSLLSNLETTSGKSIERTVKLTKLDTLTSSLKKIDLIKIDVEGFEHEVLLGAEETILRHRPIIVLEYSPSFYNKNSADTKKRIVSFLKEKNYSVEILDSVVDNVVSKPDLLLEYPYNEGIWNVVCTPN